MLVIVEKTTKARKKMKIKRDDRCMYLVVRLMPDCTSSVVVFGFEESRDGGSF